MVPRRELRLAVAVAVCAIVLTAADGESVFALEGDAAEMPLGWVRNPKDLGEKQGETGASSLITSTSFSGTGDAASFNYKVAVSHDSSTALRELQGEELMGESMDEREGDARVTLAGLQAGLESQADMMGKVDRLTAVKVLMSLPAAKSVVNGLEDATSLVQVSAGAGWGRRRRGAQWAQNPVSQQKKKEEKQEGRQAQDGPKQPAKVVVKKAPEMDDGGKNMDPMQEATMKADKAIEMATEKGDKANAKAEKEAKAAEHEADDKKKFENAQKRKHELTNKEEQAREKKMKAKTEQSAKRAKEAGMKAEQLAKAVKKAKEAAEKEQGYERKMKKAKEGKNKEHRKVRIEKAKEKAAKDTKEKAAKHKAELAAKFGQEGMKKRQEETQLKHKHKIALATAREKTKKKTLELAKKTAEEGLNKSHEESALKAADEKKLKASQENAKKAQDERDEKAKKEDTEKKKREKALKEAAKRRVEEEKAAKSDKRKAMQASAQMAETTAKELQNKAKEESTSKISEENELKKTREKKEKDAREVTMKKAQEIFRKVTREHTDKIHSEKSSKEFTEQQHKEKRNKAEEGTQKILAGLKDYSESLSKARAKFEQKNLAFRKVEPVEAKHKTEANNLSMIAKELAQKIQGGGDDYDKKNPKSCDLGKNLEKIKKKGLLTAKEGQCEVKCALKPTAMGMQAQCQLLGSEKGAECQKLMYTRVQSVGSALMSEFDAFKRCEIAKKSGAKSAEGADSQWLLGEGRNAGRVQSMPKEVEDGVEVGDYIYSLKDQEDISGSISVPAAMDMLMKCHKDGKGHGSAQDDDMGESYAPDETEQYNAASGNLNSYCKTSTVQETIDNIAVPSGGGVEYKCATYGVEADAYTADCNGGGKIADFLQSAEAYHRNVASTYLTWKAKCAAAANGREEEEEQGEELLRLR